MDVKRIFSRHLLGTKWSLWRCK